MVGRGERTGVSGKRLFAGEVLHVPHLHRRVPRTRDEYVALVLVLQRPQTICAKRWRQPGETLSWVVAPDTAAHDKNDGAHEPV